MRHLISCILIPLVLTLLIACGQRKRDAVYYEQMVDSIRRAEQVKEIQRQSGTYDDPVIAFFDSLQLRPLPLQSERSQFEKIGHFSRIPSIVASRLGYPVGTPIKALLLPKSHGNHVLLVTEQQDSLNSRLYLYTFDADYQPVDHLCLYEELDEDQTEDFGKLYMDYYVTSEYDISLLRYYESYNRSKREHRQSRRYLLNANGFFEEQVIEIED